MSFFDKKKEKRKQRTDGSASTYPTGRQLIVVFADKFVGGRCRRHAGGVGAGRRRLGLGPPHHCCFAFLSVLFFLLLWVFCKKKRLWPRARSALVGRLERGNARYKKKEGEKSTKACKCAFPVWDGCGHKRRLRRMEVARQPRYGGTQGVAGRPVRACADAGAGRPRDRDKKGVVMKKKEQGTDREKETQQSDGHGRRERHARRAHGCATAAQACAPHGIRWRRPHVDRCLFGTING